MAITVNWWIMSPSVWLLLAVLAWKVADLAVELEIPLLKEGGYYLLIPVGLGCLVPIWFPDEDNDETQHDIPPCA
mgnify:CR=1 FL=1